MSDATPWHGPRMRGVLVAIAGVVAAAALAGCGGGGGAGAPAGTGTATTGGPTRAELRSGFAAFITAARKGGRQDLATRFAKVLGTPNRGGFGLFQVPSDSMAPALRTGDRAIGETAAIGPLARGEIVVLDATPAARKACGAGSGNAELIKRVIGLPGDQVKLVPGSADVTINGRPFTVAGAGPNPANAPTSVFDVPAGKFFVLGDNRATSCDSRRWSDPYVPRPNVTYRIDGIYFPRARAGLVK